MKKKEIQINYIEYNSLDELNSSERLLLENATLACDKSYAPYSKFYVGAAILLSDNTIIQGANQENASYPLCNCAEQVVLNHASMAYPEKQIQAIGVTVKSGKEHIEPIPPCGACRQIILEYEIRQKESIAIYLLSSTNTIYKFNSIKDLLPLHFKF